MQVKNNIESVIYTAYKKSKNAGFEKIFGTDYESGENNQYEKSVIKGGTDNERKYLEWESRRKDIGNYQNINVQEDNKSVYKVEDKGEGEFLGLTMIPEEGKSVTYGMVAVLLDESSMEKPIVQVVSNLGGIREIYNVDVSKVNPKNATQLEMFALLSYTDKMGITDGGTFGSHQKLEVYADNASYIGYCKKLDGGYVFLNERFNWADIMEKMMKQYLESGIINQYEDCRNLFGFFNILSEETEINEEDYQKILPGRVNQTEDYQKILKERIKELFEKIQNGDTETTYVIGANSYTENEWNNLMERFDFLQDAIKEAMREEEEKEMKEKVKEKAVNNKTEYEKNINILTAESTYCTYPTANPNDDDIHYITWYTKEGIFCRKAGQEEGYEWSVNFDDKSQYDRVMELIGQFPYDWNMRFAAHENFWTDFLNNEIEMDDFMEFMSGTNKGVPDYSITKGDSMYIDEDKIRWAKYLNPLGSRFYTIEQLRAMQPKFSL